MRGITRGIENLFSSDSWFIDIIREVFVVPPLVERNLISRSHCERLGKGRESYFQRRLIGRIFSSLIGSS